MPNPTLFKPPLSYSVLYVLLALHKRPLHGYGILMTVTEVSVGSVRMRTGTLYPLLKRLMVAGIIEATDRRHYGLTAYGRSLLESEARRLRHVLDYLS